jgi:sigma-54 dependent transcriptional regulator, acetoin dehydrogenase operon transcriptional activator AcoR
LQLPSDHVEAIVASHERCLALGLSRFEQPDLSPLPRADVAIALDRHRRLHAHAAPVMEMLYEQIARTQSMVVLCDAAGTIVHSIGDDDFLPRASQVALTPGANWAEQSKGTNAIGTALVSEAPTLVHADEHFMHANHFLTCSAAPILDPRGNILGVLDVTGDHRSYHRHTMALVRMSVRMIENHWLADDCRHVMRLHFHRRAEYIGTLMEGIVGVGPDGRIVGANRSALEQLEMSGATLRMHSLAHLFGTSVGTLAQHFARPSAAPLTVHDPRDRPLHLVARIEAQHGYGSALAAPSSAPVSLPAPRVEPEGLIEWQGADESARAVAAQLRRAIGAGLPVLLIGETGTGKSSLARACHQASSRARQPFVTVECASVSPAQLHSRLAQARGGSLLLRDLDQLPAELQAPLLHWLRDSAMPARDVLIVSACTREASPALREDLYHRLAAVVLHLPPLRQRSDLALLAAQIVERVSDVPAPALSPDVTALLRRHAWPGNLRELSNALRAACLAAAGQRTLQRAHLPQTLLDTSQASLPTAMGGEPVPTATSPSLENIELEAIRRAVENAGGNISRAARNLGVSRNTIYRRLHWRAASSNAS